MDPFASFLAPPPNETPVQKAQRQKKEAQAQAASDRIDEELKAERAALKKQQKTTIKVLLLGQAESGKSTTLKNLRMAYATDEWNRERTAWRAVVQLNLVRAVLTILDTLDAELSGEEYHDPEVDIRSPSPIPYNFDNTYDEEPINDDWLPFTDDHHTLKLRLSPLRQIELDLRNLLGAGADEDTADSTSSDGHGSPRLTSKWSKARVGDFTISFRTWQELIQGKRSGQTSRTASRKSSRKFSKGGVESVTEDATDVLVACREDMMWLWSDPIVQKLLKKRRVSLGESSTLYVFLSLYFVARFNLRV